MNVLEIVAGWDMREAIGYNVCKFSARGYGQFWGMRSGSGLVLGSGDGLAVAEADTADDVGEAVGTIQSAPVALGRLGELEDHGERGLA